MKASGLSTTLKGIMGFFYSAGKSIGMKNYIIAGMLLLAFTIRLIYLGYTPFDSREHDVGGHVLYYEYVSANLHLPPVNYSEQTYHPPVYYVIAALIHKTLSIFLVPDAAIKKAIQFFSLVSFMGFLIAGTLVIKRYVRNDLILFFCLAILYFWPSSVIHSVRIGNEDLFYFFFGMSLYFLFKWYDEKKQADLSLFTLFGILAFLTKVNGITLFGLFGIMVLIRFFREEKKARFTLSVLPSFTLLFIVALASFCIPFVMMFVTKATIPFFKGGEGLPAQLLVGNEAKNYLFFDFKTFLNEPFTSPWDDQFGRQYFWNYLFKTGLFGEFSYDGVIFRNLGTIISFCFLVLTALFMMGVFILKKQEVPLYLPPVLMSMILVLSALGFRMHDPYSCSNDFRYILPIIALVPIFIDRAVSFFKEKGLGILQYAAYSVIIVFAGSSIAFFLFLK